MQDAPEGTGPAEQPATQKPRKKRRWGRWVLGIGGVLIVILAIVLAVVPKYAARYIMEDELAKLGIQTTGVETLDIRLWRGEVVMGPVEFWSEDGERGTIGQVGAKLSLASLLKQRALVETFIIEEVDLIVEKRQGELFLNGIPLAQFMTVDDAAAAEAEPQQEDGDAGGTGWGAGIDRFDFRDSRLILRNFVPDDDLVIEIDSLFVTLFHTWQPEEPGVVSLRGRLDGAPVAFDATAQPFADDISFRFEMSLTDLPVADIFDYGRLALVLDRDILTKREGTVSQTQSYSGVLYRDGWIEMNGRTTATISDFDVTTDAGDDIRIAGAELNLLTSETYTEDGSLDLGGKVVSRFNGVDVVTADGIALQIESAESTTDQFFVSLDADQNFDIYAPHQTTVNGLRIQPDAGSSVSTGSLTLTIPGLSVNGGPDGETRVAGTIQLEAATISAQPDANTALDVGKLATTISDLDLMQSEAAGVTLDAAMRTEITDLAAKQGAELGVNVAAATVELAGLALTQSPDGRLRIETQPRIDVSSTEMTGATPMTVDQVTVALSSLVTEMVGETIAVRTTGATDVGGIAVTMPDEDGQPGTEARIETVRVDLDPLQANVAGERIDVSGAVATAVGGMSATIGQPQGPLEVTAESLETRLSTLSAQLAGETTTVDIAGTTALGGVNAAMPAGNGLPEMAVTLSTLEVALNKVAAVIAGGQPEWNVALDVAGQGIGGEIKTLDDTDTMAVERLTVSGLEADHQMAVAANEILIDGLTVDVTDQTLKAFGGGDTAPAGGESEKPEETPAASASGPQPTARLARLAIGAESWVKFTDTSLEPPVMTTIVFNDVELKNIDTGNPETKTDITVDAKINEFTNLAVLGWAAPLKPTPDFDLGVDVENLSLPTYSPYVANAIGWHLDGGELTTDVKADATASKLNGDIRVLVDNLFLNPVTAEDGAELEKELGLPVQFAVGILKDDKGRIDLAFPLGGTVEQPEVDYSDAINTAVSGFLGSIFGGDTALGAGGFELSSIVFPPGSATFDAAGQQVADQYLTLLQKKSSLRLGVCGRATAADYAALYGGGAAGQAAKSPAGTAAETQAGQAQGGQPQAAPPAPPATVPTALTTAQAKGLIELAQSRTNTVRRYFIEEKGIAAERIVECRVTFDLKDQQPPRVQFAM